MNKPKSRSGASPARQSGVTLIELIVTVIVIGILAAIAVPSFTNFLERQRLVGAASALYSEFRYARSESLKRDQIMTISFDLSNTAQWCFGLVASAASCDCSSPASGDECEVDNVQRTESFDNFPGVTLTANPASTSLDMTINPVRGTISSTHTLIVTNSEGNKLEVRTTKLGSPSICVPTGFSVSGYEECP